VFRATYKDRQGRRRESAKWYVEFSDHLDYVRRLPAYTDRKQSAELGRKTEKLVASRANGEEPDKELSKWLETLPARVRKRLADIDLLSSRTVAASKPLAEHLDDFKAGLRAKGTSARHAEQTVERARRVFEGCGFRFWSEIDALTVERHVAEMGAGETGLSLQTRNFYLQAVKQFGKWMVLNRRASESLVDHLKGQNVQTERRHDRRALSIDELRRVLDTAANGPERFGMLGSERALVYRLALETGLRANEIRTLRRASFDFRGDPATVTVKAAYSKRRRQDVLPLRPNLGEALRRHLPTKLPTAPVFSVPRSYDMADMLRADLTDARTKWIGEARTETDKAEREKGSFLAYRDDAGRVAAFHSLRHTFISNLAQAGVHPKLAQSLARHSDINLTLSRYTHTTRGQESAALAALPDLSPSQCEQQRATGTDGRVDLPLRGSIVLADCLAEKVTEGSNSVHCQAANASAGDASPECDNTRENQTKPLVFPSENPIRLAGFEPATYGLGNRCSIP